MGVTEDIKTYLDRYVSKYDDPGELQLWARHNGLLNHPSIIDRLHTIQQNQVSYFNVF